MRVLTENVKRDKVQPNQVTMWKKHLPDRVDEVIESSSSLAKKARDERDVSEPFEQISQMKVELELLQESCRKRMMKL